MPKYADSVFLNVPFDRRYKRIFDALVFAVHDSGFTARSALEVEESSEARVDKILNIIDESKFGIHDISRAGTDRATKLARFNMPLELGFFLGAKRYGSNWLSGHTSGVQMPGGKAIFERYEGFRAQMPAQARDLHLHRTELTFGDYTKLVVGWLKKNQW